jgi:hypothetical protein
MQHVSLHSVVYLDFPTEAGFILIVFDFNFRFIVTDIQEEFNVTCHVYLQTVGPLRARNLSKVDVGVIGIQLAPKGTPFERSSTAF